MRMKQILAGKITQILKLLQMKLDFEKRKGKLTFSASCSKTFHCLERKRK